LREATLVEIDDRLRPHLEQELRIDAELLRHGVDVAIVDADRRVLRPE